MLFNYRNMEYIDYLVSSFPFSHLSRYGDQQRHHSQNDKKVKHKSETVTFTILIDRLFYWS